jgi:FkbM family methyltransferase
MHSHETKKNKVKKYLRAIQTRLSFLQDTRFRVTSCFMMLTKMPHEEDFYALAKFNPEPDEVLIDVGANRGMTIVSMLLFKNLKNRIIGFEPNLRVFDKLQDNPIIRGNKQISLHMCGLSDYNVKLPLYVPFYGKWMFDGLASLDYRAAKNWLNSDRFWGFDKGKVRVESLNCELKKLDDFGLNPYFIKIDVQGHELQVLKGAEKTIEQYHPILLIECVTKEICEFLNPYGYRFFAYGHGKFQEELGCLNTFCMTTEKYASLNFHH